ncbi:MAG TPA: hypothetical protein VFY89_03850 [Ktedonobacterales bacterium]
MGGSMTVVTRGAPGEEAFVGIQINALYLVPVVFAWLLVSHIVYWLVAVVRDESLVAWSVGPLGINVVALRRPPARLIAAQLGCAALAVALAAYISLFVLDPGPISGLARSLPVIAAAVAIPVVVLTFGRLLGILREVRVPLWGEARVLARVQRSAVTGALIFFTPTGRSFLRDRFNATPGEFVRMLRR